MIAVNGTKMTFYFSKSHIVLRQKNLKDAEIFISLQTVHDLFLSRLLIQSLPGDLCNFHSWFLLEPTKVNSPSIVKQSWPETEIKI